MAFTCLLVDTLVRSYQPVHRSDVDDHTLPLGEHRLDSGLRAQERPGQVHLDGLIPQIQWVVLKTFPGRSPADIPHPVVHFVLAQVLRIHPIRRHTHVPWVKFRVQGGAVHQDIQAPKGAGGTIYHALHRLAGCDVR